MSEIDELKRAAARSATEWIRDGMVLGLGTGSTVYYVLEEIGTRRTRGEWKEIVGVSTSDHTTALAHRFGIPLAPLAERPSIDLAIDGADEVDPELRLIKGLGGALLREKLIAIASETVLIAVDASKRVARLGTRSPVPVEVEPFGESLQDPFFRALGAEPRRRLGPDRQPVVTDGGNHLVDCHFPDGIDDPVALDARLNGRPGVLEHGLFIDLVDHVLTASPSGVEVQSRGDALP